MTRRRVVCTLPDGRVRVRTPVIGPDDPEGFTEADGVARARETLPEGVTDVDDIDVADLPDRMFRDAWKREGRGIGVDMPHAREIHMARIRAARDARLRALDDDEIEALSKQDQDRLDEVRARKQGLRDLPAIVDLESAETPDALKAVWPADLET